MIFLYFRSFPSIDNDFFIAALDHIDLHLKTKKDEGTPTIKQVGVPWHFC